VTVMTPDTALAPFDWGTGASRSSLMMGMALQEAANDILRQLGEFVADCFGVQTEGLAFAPGGVMAGGATPANPIGKALAAAADGEFVDILIR